MKHFTTEEWIDFVNHVVPNERHDAMQQHLHSGCRQCADEVHVWERVRNIASNEYSLQPPAEAVTWVKNAYGSSAAAIRKTKDSLVELLFDSFLQPALAGIRTTANGSRQMLYRAGSYQVDIQIEVKPNSNLLAVAGQIMDVSSNDTDATTRGIPVTLSNLHGHVIYLSTNEFGEFRAEIENSGDLQLSIPRRGENPISISLRNALNEIPGANT